MSPDEVRNLDAHTLQEMWLAITNIEAREIINQLIVSSYPELETSKRKSVMSDLERQSKIGSVSELPEASNAEIDAWLRSKLGG
jgi:hypothetical protein